MFIAERAKQLRILPSDVDHLQTARLLSVSKANIRAAQAYLPQDCTQPLLLFSAEEELEDEERADRRDLYELASGERKTYYSGESLYHPDTTAGPVDSQTVKGSLRYFPATDPVTKN
jgi:hypothetical protein